MRIMLPFSTNGRKASCCALLKRWISSTNRIVRSPKRRFFSACSMTCLISLMPLVTAEKSIKFAFVRFAMMRASVVFPTPGGPQNIIEPTLSLSMSLRNTLPSPSKCFCPQYSSRDCGRSLAARGRLTSFSKNVGCSNIIKSPERRSTRQCDSAAIDYKIFRPRCQHARASRDDREVGDFRMILRGRGEGNSLHIGKPRPRKST